MPLKSEDGDRKRPDQDHPAHVLLSRAHSPDSASTVFTSKVLHRPLLLRKSSPTPATSSNAAATHSKPFEPTGSSNSRPLNPRDRRRAARLARNQRHRRTTTHEPDPSAPAPSSSSAAAATAAQLTISRPPRMSAKRRRALGLWDIPKEHAKWSIYLGLWKMWCEYAREILGLRRHGELTKTTAGGGGGGERMDVDGGEAAGADVGAIEERREVVEGSDFIAPQAAGALLASADMHGARVRVARSRCVERVGVGGIVVRDGRGAFEVVTEKDEVKILPKEGTVFRLEIPRVPREGAAELRPLVVEIYGERFMVRPADRATKRFKMHYVKDL